MGEITVQLNISEAKLRDWVAQRVGVKNAMLPSIEAAQAAIDEFVKENSLWGVSKYSLHTTESAGTLALVISGESESFRKLCQALDRQFSPI